MVMVKGSDAGALMRRLDYGKQPKTGKHRNMYLFLAYHRRGTHSEPGNLQ